MFCRLLFIRLALVFILFSIMGCRDLPEKQFHEENADEFFDKAVIQTIEINIAPADRQAMFDALPERIYVPATFVWRDMRLENVGVRFKGNSSSQPDSWWKRGLLVKFGEVLGYIIIIGQNVIFCRHKNVRKNSTNRSKKSTTT